MSRGGISILNRTRSAVVTLAQDSFSTRTVSGGWGTASSLGGPWSEPIGTPGFFSVGSGSGKIALDNSGAVQGAELVNVNAKTLTVNFDVSFSALPSAGNYVFATTWTRISSDAVSSFYRIGIFVDTTGTVCLRGEGVPAVTLWPDATPVGTPVLPANPFASDAWLTVSSQLATISTTTANASVWTAGTTEPSSWGVSGVDTGNVGPQIAGAVGIRAWSTVDPITVYFENFKAVLV